MSSGKLATQVAHASSAFLIENNYMPNSVRVTCPICHSIFEFDPATECDKEKFKTYRDGQEYIDRTVTCPCCNKSFIIERNYPW